MSDFPQEKPDPEMAADDEESAEGLVELLAQHDTEKADSSFSKFSRNSQPSRSKKETLWYLHRREWCEER